MRDPGVGTSDPATVLNGVVVLLLIVLTALIIHAVERACGGDP